VTGLELGATYEARARIAIWFADDEAIATFGGHTAREYRYGEGSSLGARYERLMDEAHRTGRSALPELVDAHGNMTTSHARWASAASAVQHRLADAGTAEARTERALRLLCDARGASAGHLYLQTERGLVCVASLGEHPPDHALHDLAARVLEEVALLSVEPDTTATASETAAPSTSDVVPWTDSTAGRYRPLLLMGEIDGLELCAGVAMIEASDGTEVALGTRQLAEAIAEYLLRAGDARDPRRGDR
jgi:hypothetical protein